MTKMNSGFSCTQIVPARRQLLVAGALALGGFANPKAGSARGTRAAAGILRNAAAIHQEPVFTASRKRLYGALTDAEQFDKVIQLSGVMKGAKSPVPTAISTAEGGAFALFGGYITGRQLELQPEQLIAQAWRAGSWGAGLYSIARFQLVDHENGSKIVFDHGGFPDAEAEHLAAGWQANYWSPLAKLLSQ
ncbi:MAG TPA: SRPBCC domain-containing protein [Steroidobacteraceae bacterium]|jgi:activator of HSP90 ATPase|nr:SRPBCC domain-containing protein [Steroidobacteraceae bacterium]